MIVIYLMFSQFQENYFYFRIENEFTNWRVSYQALMTLLVDNHQQQLHQVKRATEEAICFLTIPVKPGLVARL